MRPTHHEIAERAYFRWEGRGREHGRDLEDWLWAEWQAMREWHSTLTLNSSRQIAGYKANQ